MSSDAPSAVAERRHDMLFVSAERFTCSPQIGTPCAMTRAEFITCLSRHTIGEAKDQSGALSPAKYRDNIRRKSNLISVCMLVLDIDEHGDVDQVAEVLAKYRCVVHETFSSMPESPRCRAWIELAEPVDAQTYEAVHRVARAHLGAAGLVVDEGAKDASRVSYMPVRRAGAGYRFRQIDGVVLDARAVLAAQPPPPPRSAPRPIAPERRDVYVRGALRRAAAEVANANEGIRHYTLSREAFALARLGLSEHEITRALLPSFIGAAGEHRELEGRRTIRDAVRARLGVA